METYHFKLYIAGNRSHSERTKAAIHHICETYLKDHYTLEIIDVLQNPELANDDNIMATPTLICTSPKPENRIIGDLSNEEFVIHVLNIPTD